MFSHAFARPQTGADSVYDEKCKKIEMVKSELENELRSLSKRYPKAGEREYIFEFIYIYILQTVYIIIYHNI